MDKPLENKKAIINLETQKSKIQKPVSNFDN